MKIGDGNFQLDQFAVAEAESSFVVVPFEIEIGGALERAVGVFRGLHAVQRERALIVKSFKSADEKQSHALLREAQRYDILCLAVFLLHWCT